MSKVVGVLGGMGPQATVDFFNKVVNMSSAKSDQEHIHLIIDNNPQLPDRTSYILGKGKNPLQQLVASALKLQMLGSDFLVMPCNTAHFFYDDIAQMIDIPLMNMIEAVAEEIKTKYGSGALSGLLGTIGTYRGGKYASIFKRHNLHLILPEEKESEIVNQLIYKIKQGSKDTNLDELVSLITKMKSEGAAAVILGCTELPLIMQKLPGGIDYVDTTYVLARRTVQMAYGIPPLTSS